MLNHEVKTKFFTESQNNSGGYFIRNEHVDHYVIVEATSVQEAKQKLAEITEDYSEFCGCCGERWYPYWSESDGKDIPMIYGTPVEEYRDMWQGGAIVYYYDGTKRKFDLTGVNAE